MLDMSGFFVILAGLLNTGNNNDAGFRETGLH